MSTQVTLDKAIEEMHDVFKKNPGLQQLLKHMHGYVVAPSPETAHFMRVRINGTIQERWIKPAEAQALHHFVRIYLYVFDNMSPTGQHVTLAKLADHMAQQTVNRFIKK